MKLRDVAQKLNSSLDARMLVKAVTGLSDADIIGMDAIPLTTEQFATLEDFIAQRLNRRPVAKIIGHKEFYGRDFHVNDDVLDPRPETELIIDEVLKYAHGKNSLKILDLGTGSGCIILTLLSELPNATGIGTDISPQAVSVATKNAKNLNLSERVKLTESNWLDTVDGQFDVIVTNPPYIETHTVNHLDKDVRDYDPILALDGGEHGLDPYKVILPQIRKHLKKDGLFMCEHGAGQAHDIKGIAVNAGFTNVRVHHDLAGHDRCISFILTGE